MRDKITLATLKAIIDEIIAHAPDKRLEDIDVILQIRNGFSTTEAKAVTSCIDLGHNTLALFGGTQVPGE